MLTALAAGQTSHRWPSFLPDGNHLVFHKRTTRSDDSIIAVTALDGSVTKDLFSSAFAAVYVDGFLLSVTHGVLSARSFQLDTLDVRGDAAPIAQGVAGSTTNYPSFAATAAGVLAFATETVAEMRLAWFDRNGRLLGVVGPPRDYADVELMSDGRHALVTRTEPSNTTSNIFSIDVATGDASPLTFDATTDAQPVVSPDDRQFVFRSSLTIPAPLVRRSIADSGADMPLAQPVDLGVGNMFPSDWSADGRFILFHAARPATGYDVFVLPLTGDQPPYAFAHTRGADLHARLSPDGRWIAYSSAEGGRHQIYVQPFPGANGRWQLSTDGGAEPRWRGDGRELYFISADRRLMAVPITAGASTFAFGPPIPLFNARVLSFANPYRTSYDVTKDGQRFLVSGQVEDATVPPIKILVNWQALLKK